MIKKILLFIFIFFLSVIITNAFEIYEDLNVTGNVTVQGNYICDDSYCYLISGFNASGEGLNETQADALYLRRDGGNVATGPLDMNFNDIVNIQTLDAVSLTTDNGIVAGTNIQAPFFMGRS